MKPCLKRGKADKQAIGVCQAFSICVHSRYWLDWQLAREIAVVVEMHPGNAGLRKAHYHRIPCWLKHKSVFQTSGPFLVYHNGTPSQLAWRSRITCAAFLHLVASWDGFPTSQSTVSPKLSLRCAQAIRHDWYTPIASTSRSPILKAQLTQ